MVDYNDNNSDTELWNYVIKTTKKIVSNNSSNHYKNILKNKRHQFDVIPEIKPQKTYLTNKRNTSFSPIHFSKENNTSGLSKKNIKEIVTGKFKVQSKLDLHGYRLKEAETLFFNFIQNSFKSKKRNILVISGKGEYGRGKIKLSIPVWITSPYLSPLIYFYSCAAPSDGGNGAYYIRLRKNDKA